MSGEIETATATEAVEQGPAEEALAVEQVEHQPEAGAAQEAGEAPLGEGGQKALAAEREARKAAEAEAKTEREQRAELADRLEDAQRRAEVARVLRLSDKQAELLVGKTADEMQAHGEAMVAAFAPTPIRRRPLEALRSGAMGIESAPPTPGQIADEVLAG